jgi:hypothetical protein
MKVNLKKIGAIVAGATILASSAAFAGLMFGSTTLVDDNGAPVAKVVIGSKAQPSDAVAGALIAGKMVGEAYKSQTLSAQVSGTASCTGGSGTGGTCSITNEKARLEITVPGSVAAGTWTGENLIGDYLNRKLLDREPSVDPTDSDQAYEMGGSDTSENANPFTDGVGGNIGATEEYFYRVDGNSFSTFADKTVVDDDAGKTYVEMQNLWIKGDNRFDTDANDVVGRLDFLAYSMKFDGPGGDELGIPECTQAEDMDFASCKDGVGDTTIDDGTETHRVKVWFLGEEWIISEMNAPIDSDPSGAVAGDGILNENQVWAGGSVKLAKESVSGILNQGESLPVDNLKFQLDDLEAHGDTTSAILSILDANGNVLKKDKVAPGETKEFNVAGKTYRFHVYKVAPGYTFGAKWADVAIFAKELELVDGQELDQDVGLNDGYQVALGWKNMDAANGVAVVNGGNPEAVDTLRSVVVYSDSIEDISNTGDDVLEEGDYVSLVQDPVIWKLSYTGLDLTSEDMSSLKFELKTTKKTISDSKGPYADGVGDTDKDACEIYGPYAYVKSGTSGSVFEVDRDDASGTGQLSDSEFYVALNGGDTAETPGAGTESGWCDADHDGVYGSAGDVSIGPGTVFMRVSPSGDYGFNWDAWGGAAEVRYDKIADGDNAFSSPEGGAILIQDNWWSPSFTAGDDYLWDMFESTTGGAWAGFSTAQVPDMFFAIAEKAGTSSSNEFVDYWVFGVADIDTGTPGDATFSFNSEQAGVLSVTTDNDEMLYGHATANAAGTACEYYWTGGVCVPSGPVVPDMEMVDTGYISERGSQLKTIDDNSVVFDMAHKLARAKWYLAPSTTSAADASKTIVTLGEGESETVSGVTIKVLEITEDVGACSAGGGSVSCTADMSGVSAVIMPNNAPSVAVAMPYTGNYGNLVVLDTDAVGVNTLVSVGGDKVNSVTADLLQGSAVDWTAERKVVREVVQGSKIVVAGKEAADTLEAAQDFVAQVRKV